MKQKITKAALGFLCIMITFTILARAAYSISTPKVVVDRGHQMELGPEIFADGVVEAGKEVAVMTVGQQVIQTVAVIPGQKVEAKDVLFELNLERLEEHIAQKLDELKGIDLQISSAKSEQEAAGKSRKLMQIQAEADYRKAVESGDEEMKIQAKRALDMANLPVGRDTSIEQMNLSRKNVEKELKKLVALKEVQGKITAPVSGVVSEVNVKAGNVTSGLADVMILDGSSEKVLKVTFPKEYKEYIVRGADVTIQSVEKTEKARLDIVGESMDGSGNIEATIIIPKDSFGVGTPLSLQMKTAKKMYTFCLPLEAVHQGENGFYVNILDRKKSILGDEFVAKRMKVGIEYKGEGFVAVDSVGSDEKIIISADRQIENGGRVKPLEQ